VSRFELWMAFSNPWLEQLNNSHSHEHIEPNVQSFDEHDSPRGTAFFCIRVLHACLGHTGSRIAVTVVLVAVAARCAQVDDIARAEAAFRARAAAQTVGLSLAAHASRSTPCGTAKETVGKGLLLVLCLQHAEGICLS